MPTVYSTVEMDTFVASLFGDFVNESKIINLMDFNPKRIDDIVAFEVCSILSNLFDHKIRLQMPLLKFWLFKLKNRDVKITRIAPSTYITEGPQWKCEELNEKILKSLQFEHSILNQIYEEYYKKG